MDDNEADLREQIFHNNVREQIIFLLLFILLYISSYAIIEKFRRRDRDDIYSSDEDEVTVYRVSLWLCTFALAVSLGSALLLPVSIVSNEVLIIYPNSYYVKWLNSSLIQGLWNHVFLFSNLSLFVFLPFAYLFSESSGFTGCRSGIMARIYETFTVLSLLSVVMLGLAYVISSFIDKDKSSIQTFLNLWTYLPFLYSCVSFVGVLMLLVFTPLGFVRLFGVVGQVLVKPQFLRDLNEEFHAYSLEEETLRRRLKNVILSGNSYILPAPMCPDDGDLTTPVFDDETLGNEDSTRNTGVPLLQRKNGALQAGLGERLQMIVAKRKEVERQRNTSSIRRNLLYPMGMLILLLLTVLTVLMVLQNTLELLIGIKALPLSTRQFTLGISSLSKLGAAGATVEALLILYLHAASMTGLCSANFVRRALPKPGATPLPRIIAAAAIMLLHTTAAPLLVKILGCSDISDSESKLRNIHGANFIRHALPKAGETMLPRVIAATAVILLHTTAAPLLVKILGITNFDLLGDFGRIQWLGNFRLVLLYNLVFAGAATLCLVNKFTATVRRELYNRDGVATASPTSSNSVLASGDTLPPDPEHVSTNTNTKDKTE